jgi:hypothetical protein
MSAQTPSGSEAPDVPSEEGGAGEVVDLQA